MTILIASDGSVLATGDGTEIAVSMATSNDDTQMFDFSVDLLRAILWQYNDATSLQSLLHSKSDWYRDNQKEFWENWLYNVFDLRTANQFGLAVWGIILGLHLYVNLPPVEKSNFGFSGSGGSNFDNSNFSNSNGTSVLLSVDTQRRALQLRYAQLTGSGTVPEINRALKYIFGDLGRAYLIDYGNMTQQYIFMFPLTADLTYLFNNYDILPRPAGVRTTYVNGNTKYFGFNSPHLNFNQGNFGA